jgi:hypothetical protein
MGTRGITKVRQNNETKVAQYGQWDHYPSGQGVTILNFLRTKEMVDKLRENLSSVYWIKPEDHELILSEFSSSDKGKGWMTLEDGKTFSEAYPSLTRDTGGEILELIATAKAPVPLVNSDDFTNDRLFCEGIYTVDLDHNLFVTEYGDYPTKAFDLDNLPTPDEYVAAILGEETSNL